jgi:hypothetical protein
MLFHEFDVNNTPTLIVADSKGTIVRRIEPGELGSLRQALPIGTRLVTVRRGHDSRGHLAAGGTRGMGDRDASGARR